MEPTINSIVISELKKNLKEVGNLTVDLCGNGNPDPEIRDKAQAINKLAHQMYELVWLEENSHKKQMDMETLSEKGVPKMQS